MIIPVLLGAVIGILSSGTGLGGGFLVVPLLLYLGKEARNAVGTSVLFVMLVAVSSVLGHFRLGNVDFKTGLLLAAGGVFGAQIGPLLLQYVPEVHFKRGFSVILIATGVWLLAQTRG